MRTNENKEKGKMYEMYGNYVQVPYCWYGLCRKYIIPKEIKEFKDKKENTIELNPMEINVLAYLANYDDCYAANGTIAEVFKLKKKTIEKYIKELRWVGFIKTYENKETPTYTDRRNIYVQHDAIKRVLEFEGDKYRVPYECGVSDDETPSKCNLGTLQIEGEYPTDVTKVPSMCRSNKNKLENTRNYNKYFPMGCDTPPEEISQTTGGNPSEERKKRVKAPEDIFHHIIEDKIIKDNIFSSEEEILFDSSKEGIDIDFKNRTSHSPERIKSMIDKKINEFRTENDDREYILNSLLKEFCGFFYQCDEAAVIKYANMKLGAA